MGVEIGAEAPDFRLRNQHGEPVTLTQFRGRANVVLVFYPYAFSGVCTGELTELRDQFTDASDGRTALLAVSCDAMFSLRAFSERDGLAFPLLSDFWPHGEVARAYGVFNQRLGCANRTTFIVDRAGVLHWRVDNDMPRARNLDDYRKVLAELG
jgi:mycoredoxin-dependent peroxiredoxin